MTCLAFKKMSARKAAFSALGFGIVAGLAHGPMTANAGPLVPQVDFRSEAYSAANEQHSFTSSVAGVDFTISAWRYAADGAAEAADLWWDATDGLGIWGMEDDEIDSSEYLKITFDSLIGISHIFLADLFADDSWETEEYSETVHVETDQGLDMTISAEFVADSWGNAANGEAVLAFDKSHPVTELILSVPEGLPNQNFALLGFIDPIPDFGSGSGAGTNGGLGPSFPGTPSTGPEPGGTPNQGPGHTTPDQVTPIPQNASQTLFVLGFLMLAALTRWTDRSRSTGRQSVLRRQ